MRHRLAVIAMFVTLANVLVRDAGASPNASAARKDWAAALEADATAFRDAIAGSHPGSIDSENPGFAVSLQNEYSRAIARVPKTRSYRDYAWAMIEFANAFDDGHLGVIEVKRPADLAPRFRWPGFATAIRGAGPVVVVREAAETPPLGARLIGCDGQSAESFTSARLATALGRWQISSRRQRLSAQLFLPPDSPFYVEARRCSFRVQGHDRGFELRWRPIEPRRRDQLLSQAIGSRHKTGIGLRSFANGTAWIDLGSFESDSRSAQGKALVTLEREIAAHARALANAPVLVFDLRGNDGGSSLWINQAAKAIWGPGYVAARAPRSAGTDWRVSEPNIAALRATRLKLAESANPQSIVWLEHVIAGMEQARARGESLWFEKDDEVVPAAESNRVVGRAFVLTDSICASACLDAVDILTALGAAHVGQETSADTLYMDIRMQPLPSGHLTAYLPMKVYRGRTRGANISAVPAYAWTGEMADTAAIRQWIEQLH